MTESKFKTICAWCDKSKELTKKLEAKWYIVSHWICKKHAKIFAI